MMRNQHQAARSWTKYTLKLVTTVEMNSQSQNSNQVSSCMCKLWSREINQSTTKQTAVRREKNLTISAVFFFFRPQLAVTSILNLKMQIFTRYLISTRPRRKANCIHGMCLERYQITLAHWTTQDNFHLPLMWKMHKRKLTWNRCGHFKQKSHKKSGCFRGKHLVPSPSFFAGRLVHVFIRDLDFMPSENLLTIHEFRSAKR